MAITISDLDNFHRFAAEKLRSGGADLDLDELLMLWYDEQDRDQVNAIIQQGLEDIEAGRGRPARQVAEELRQRFNLPTE
jgi:hypothetical protein